MSQLPGLQCPLALGISAQQAANTPGSSRCCSLQQLWGLLGGSWETLGRPEDKGLLRTIEPSYPPNHEISSALRSLWLLRCLLLHISAVDVWSKSCPFWVNIWAGYNSRGKCLILLSVISFPLLDTNMTLTGQMACNRHHFRKTKCLRTIIYKDLLTQEQKLD